MTRRPISSSDDISWLRQKIAQLNYEKANMRLWKEKDSADASAARAADVTKLVSEVNRRGQEIENLQGLVDRLKSLLTQKDDDLRLAQEREQNLAAELNSVLRSLSWRATQPLRYISSIIRSGRVSSPAPHNSVTDQQTIPETELTTAPAGKDARVAWGQPWSVSSFLGDRSSEMSASSRRRGAVDSANYMTGGKDAWDRFGRKSLHDFNYTNQELFFPVVDDPAITIIVVSHNNPHLLLLNLTSVKHNADVSYEVVIVDNSSDRETLQLLDRVRTAKIIKNPANAGFPKACMQGAASARGQYLCFLNNDALLEADCLSMALKAFADDATVGAVGGKIIQSDGLLQEAGAILWSDGTTNGYGCGDDPNGLPHLFRRPVDYCSGAFLVTPRTLFNEVGGFDELFSPGYYEDTDYCTRLWANGRQVIYEPRCTIRHYGNAGSRNKGDALAIVIANHERFCERWSTELTRHYEARGENVAAARFAAADTHKRILVIATEVPKPSSNDTPPSEWKLLHGLLLRGHVTCAVTGKPPEERDYIYTDRRIELVDATGDSSAVIRMLALDCDLISLRSDKSLPELCSALRDIDTIAATVELYTPSGVQYLTFVAFQREFLRPGMQATVE